MLGAEAEAGCFATDHAGLVVTARWVRRPWPRARPVTTSAPGLAGDRRGVAGVDAWVLSRRWS